jgi:hypothetical protein
MKFAAAIACISEGWSEGADWTRCIDPAWGSGPTTRTKLERITAPHTNKRFTAIAADQDKAYSGASIANSIAFSTKTNERTCLRALIRHGVLKP